LGFNPSHTGLESLAKHFRRKPGMFQSTDPQAKTPSRSDDIQESIWWQ
jgi:hypothetical protein